MKYTSSNSTLVVATSLSFRCLHTLIDAMRSPMTVPLFFISQPKQGGSGRVNLDL